MTVASPRRQALRPIGRLDGRRPPDELVELEIVGGVRIVVRNRLDEATPWILFEQEDWFDAELAWLRRAVRPGATILDAAAGHGVAAASLAALVGAGGSIIACERDPAVHARLRRTFELHGGGRHQATPRGRPVAAWPMVALPTDPAQADPGCLLPDLVLDDLSFHDGALPDRLGSLRACDPMILFPADQADPARNRRTLERLAAHGYQFYRHLAGFDAMAPLDACFTDGFARLIFACRPERAVELAARGLLVTPTALAAAEHEARAAIAAPAATGWPTTLATLEAALLGDAPLAVRIARAMQLTRSWLGGLRDFVDLVDHPGQLCGLVRLLLAVGAREAALEASRPLLHRFQAGTLAIDEPFLPILPRFDGRPDAGRPDLAGLALIECVVQAMAHSGFFATDLFLPTLDQLRDHPCFPSALERRRQLLACRRGDQPAILATPRLTGSRNLALAEPSLTTAA